MFIASVRTSENCCPNSSNHVAGLSINITVSPLVPNHVKEDEEGSKEPSSRCTENRASSTVLGTNKTGHPRATRTEAFKSHYPYVHASLQQRTELVTALRLLPSTRDISLIQYIPKEKVSKTLHTVLYTQTRNERHEYPQEEY